MNKTLPQSFSRSAETVDASAVRRSDRIRAIEERSKSQRKAPKKYLPNPGRKRSRDLDDLGSSERPKKRLQTQTDKQLETRKRPREDKASSSNTSPEQPSKRDRTVGDIVRDARIDFWRKNGTWATEEEEKAMDRFRDIVQHALARKKSTFSLRRKRSDASINTETVPTRTASDQQPREQKSAPYRHPRYEGQLRERGSFKDDHNDGITRQSEELIIKLLKTPRKPPDHTLFSDDDLFEKTCKSLKGENETKVILRIAELIFPSAEILSHRGTKDLDILRETTNAGWNNCIPFYGPRPQPDFGLGFKREAFTRDRLQKLQPFIGNELEDCSYIAATYNMYLPFFTSEVKCGASALDIADRQNLHSQTVALRNQVELFRLVGRLNELHREINGFSISHSDEYVRIWAHYVVVKGEDVKGEDVTFHRHPIANFTISPTPEGDQRWKAWTIVMNVFDFWVPGHFKKLCSAIDMLPADLNFDVSQPTSSRSGLSQQLDHHSLVEGQVPDGHTPATTISESKKKRMK